MKTLKSVLRFSLLLVVTSSLNSKTFAQQSSLPPELSQNSSVQEILDYLNRTSFPYARIGWGVGEDDYYPMFVSQGFSLVSGQDDCNLLLRNQHVTVYDAGWKKPFGVTSVSGAQPPYTADFSARLETVSYDGGKAPFLEIKDPERAKFFGAWGTELKSRGFFTRPVFGLKFPAFKIPGLGAIIGGDEFEKITTVTFLFDDRQEAERFDSAFRRVIRLCQSRSPKPRYDR